MSTPAELVPPRVDAEYGGLRLMVLARKFWPYSGAAEQNAADLSLKLASMGHQVEVATVRWSKTWPTFFRLQNVGVHRLSRPNSGPWGSYRYSRGISRQIINQSPDAIIVMGLGHELTTVHKNFGGQIPYLVVLNELDLGIEGDATKLNHRQLKSIAEADSVICESDWTQERLVALGGKLGSTKVVVANDGVVSHERTITSLQRNIVRRALGDAHPMLVVPDGQPLVACFSPLLGDRGMIQLVQAWEWVAGHLPGARLWLVGDGPRSREVWDAIVNRQLTDSVIMPGEFDLLEDIAVAADLIVHNLESKLFCRQFLRAFVNGSAAIVSEPMWNHLRLEGDDAVLAKNQSPQALGTQMIELLNEPDRIVKLSRNASDHRSHFRLADRMSKFLSPILEAIQSE